MAEYLETHARQISGATDTIDIIAAEAILTHIRKGALKDGFTARDVHRPGWSKLTIWIMFAGGSISSSSSTISPPMSVAIPLVAGGRRCCTGSIRPRGGRHDRPLPRKTPHSKITKGSSQSTAKTDET